MGVEDILSREMFAYELDVNVLLEIIKVCSCHHVLDKNRDLRGTFVLLQLSIT